MSGRRPLKTPSMVTALFPRPDTAQQEIILRDALVNRQAPAAPVGVLNPGAQPPAPALSCTLPMLWHCNLPVHSAVPNFSEPAAIRSCTLLMLWHCLCTLLFPGSAYMLHAMLGIACVPICILHCLASNPGAPYPAPATSCTLPMLWPCTPAVHHAVPKAREYAASNAWHCMHAYVHPALFGRQFWSAIPCTCNLMYFANALALHSACKVSYSQVQCTRCIRSSILHACMIWQSSSPWVPDAMRSFLPLLWVRCQISMPEKCISALFRGCSTWFAQSSLG